MLRRKRLRCVRGTVLALEILRPEGWEQVAILAAIERGDDDQLRQLLPVSTMSSAR